MTHRGYEGRVEFDERDGMLHGLVAGIRDVVTFQGSNAEEVAAAFRDSVDDYLDWCAEDGVAPETPFSGELTVHVSPELHRLLDELAHRDDMSPGAWIAELLRAEFADALPVEPEPAASPSVDAPAPAPAG